MRYATKAGGRGAAMTLAAALVLALAAAACGDGARTPLAPGGPDGTPSADVRASQQAGGPGNAPFYYYQGEKVFLETVPGQFVVKAKAGVDLPAAAREALADGGLDVRSGRGLPENHRIVEVPGATRGKAKGLAKRLHDHPGLTFASPAYRTEAGGDDVLPLNTVIVMFEEGASDAEIRELNRKLGTTIQREPVLEKGWRYHVLRLPEDGGKSALEIAAAYSESPLVEWADPNKISNRRLDSGSSEPFFGEQWFLDGNSQTGPNGVPVDINATDAWDNTEGSSTVEVGVYDTGVDGGHDDLDDVVAGTDPVGGPGSPTNPDVTTTPDADSHGTHVAGIIAADHNGTGVAGVAPKVAIRSYRIFNECDQDGQCERPTPDSDKQIADAINAAWKQFETDVLNNSWSGGGFSNSIAEAIEWATKDGRGGKGSVVVFSAGNDGSSVNFPATVPEAIAVSAIERSGGLSTYSNRGPEIEIAAPSSSTLGLCSGNIVTTDFRGFDGCDNGPGGDVDYVDGFGGTSAAAPQVSAAAALLISNDSSLTASQVRQKLKDAADPWGDSDKFGAGKLNIGALFYDGGGGGGGTCDTSDDGDDQFKIVC